MNNSKKERIAYENIKMRKSEGICPYLPTEIQEN